MADNSVGERPLGFGVALVCSGKCPETRIFVTGKEEYFDWLEKGIAGHVQSVTEGLPG